MVGLLFFIRASVKDRTEQIKLLTLEPEDLLVKKLKQYFAERAYRVTSIDPTKNQVTFEGFVQPSWFLAIFLTFLAGVGFFCLGLVLSLLYPSGGNLIWLPILLAPTAGIFYWQKAGKLEQVLLTVETIQQQQTNKNVLTVTGHRDELIQLRQAFSCSLVETK
jgi:hypothetical protein